MGISCVRINKTKVQPDHRPANTYYPDSTSEKNYYNQKDNNEQDENTSCLKKSKLCFFDYSKKWKQCFFGCGTKKEGN